MIPLKTQTLEVHRSHGGAYNDSGIWVPDSTPEKFKIEASVQPLTPRQLAALPENRRNKVSFNVYTETILKSITDQNPDRVIISGDEFEVFSVERWNVGFLDHIHAVVTFAEDFVG